MYYRATGASTHYSQGEPTLAISAGYVLSIGILLIAAMLLMVFRRVPDGMWALYFAGLGVLLLWLLRPWGFVI